MKLILRDEGHQFVIAVVSESEEETEMLADATLRVVSVPDFTDPYPDNYPYSWFD